MRMGRPRNKGNNRYPEGFYPPDKKNGCRMAHPITGKKMALKTRDIDEGLDRFWQIKEHFRKQQDQALITDFVSHHQGTGPFLSIIARDYRIKHLPKAISKRGASKGEPLDAQTINAYSNYLLNLEEEPLFQQPISLFGDPAYGPKVIRQYLSRWLDNPKTYNYRLTCYSRLFEHAIDLGLIQRNPCRDIRNRTTTRRDVYITHDHYKQIVKNLRDDFHEVYARACDWLYLLSGRAGNMLAIEEKHISDTEVRYYATKNKRLASVTMDKEIHWLIDWFRQYKRDVGIVSPYLIVHPLKDSHGKKLRRGIAAQPVTVEHLYRRFIKSTNKAGLETYGYTLRDLRPKALTDEAEKAGKKTNKGLHSETMQAHYIKKVVPETVTNNLKRIRWDDE